jgi:hypothetical protein
MPTPSWSSETNGSSLEDARLVGVAVVGQESPASSRDRPIVICVRSLVPKLKNSATWPTSSAVIAARGVSIIVPTR